MTVEEQYLTVDEVAAIYRKSRQTLYNWRVKGYGPKAVKIGGHLRYPVSQVKAFPPAGAVAA